MICIFVAMKITQNAVINHHLPVGSGHAGMGLMIVTMQLMLLMIGAGINKLTNTFHTKRNIIPVQNAVLMRRIPNFDDHVISAQKIAILGSPNNRLEVSLVNVNGKIKKE